uniref:NADH dehydrogenase subunit 6 n=1 Tax=Ancistrocerus parietum TaxID=1124877 RepID=A0A7L7S0X5_9HYME|nr:NADH dehydrogenase subunit 6 [Ancistrocerus parietum]
MNKSIMIIFFVFSWMLMINILLSLVIYPNLSILNFLICLIFFSLMISLNLTKFSKMTLMSYLTFLMMTGGVMILFTFFISLISNDSSFKNLFFSIFSMIFFILFLFLTKFYTLNSLKFTFIMNLNEEYLTYLKQFTLNNFFNLNYLYNYPKNFMILMLIFFLLFSLIFITKITLNNFKALRMSST